MLRFPFLKIIQILQGSAYLKLLAGNQTYFPIQQLNSKHPLSFTTKYVISAQIYKSLYFIKHIKSNEKDLYIISYRNQKQENRQMSVAEIILDPICILQMTNYFEKKTSQGLGGATFGFIFAKQVQLKFLISMATPLGTNNDSVEELLNRCDHFDKIRKTKSKNTQSYILEYELVGLYLMRRQHEKQQQKLTALSKELAKRGAPFSLIAVVDKQVQIKLLKNNSPFPYTSEMQTNQKICIDSFNNQNSKSLIRSTIQKQSTMISHFNDKIISLKQKVEKNALSEQQLCELQEILDNYQRIKWFNYENKVKALEALNYSVLVGLSVSKTMS